jgi:hypothetical protein
MINVHSPNLCVMFCCAPDARAQGCCFNYDSTSCCDRQNFPCSECSTGGFSCCPIETYDSPAPNRIYNQATGWKIFTHVSTGLDLCKVKYQSANCEELECDITTATDSAWCVPDLPPDQNCPPC